MHRESADFMLLHRFRRLVLIALAATIGLSAPVAAEAAIGMPLVAAYAGKNARKNARKKARKKKARRHRKKARMHQRKARMYRKKARMHQRKARMHKRRANQLI
jgi:hypothetical protein